MTDKSIINFDMDKGPVDKNGSEIRKAAKALQKKLKTVTDPVERKELARQMNDLFNQASVLA